MSEVVSKGGRRFRIRALMVLIAVVAVGLWSYVVIRPRVREWWVNRHVWAALNAPTSMPFAKGVPLGGMIKHVRIVTVGPNTPKGVPVYIEPADLANAGQTMGSTVTIDRTGEPLSNSLKDALAPLGLTFRVENGLLKIVEARN